MGLFNRQTSSLRTNRAEMIDRRLKRANWLAFFFAGLLVAACGGGGGGGASPGTVGGAGPQSVALPANPGSVSVGSQLFLKIIAHYADGSTTDVTLQALWQSSNSAVATVDSNTCRVVGVAEG